MGEYDVTLVTCDPLPEPDPDMEPLCEALREAGLSARVCVWDDPRVDWGASRLTLIRSTWDYYHDRAAFVRWARRVGEQSCLVNDAEIVAWNSHKRYLLELEDAGVPVVPTELCERASAQQLAEVRGRRGWSTVVVKPAVSAGSFETHVMRGAASDEARFGALLAARDMLVQPYIEHVETVGEHSVVVIDGEVSHTIRKNPRFHGEEEHVEGPIERDDEREELAFEALAVCAADPVYARVDMVDAGAGWMLTELELIEPSLFFRCSVGAAGALVDALARRSA